MNHTEAMVAVDEIIESITSLRDEQDVLRCPEDECAPCPCRFFDRANDSLREFRMRVIADASTRLKHYQTVLSEDRLDKDVEKGTIEVMEREGLEEVFEMCTAGEVLEAEKMSNEG